MTLLIPSILLLGLVLMLPLSTKAQPGSEVLYRNPHGRFAVAVPPGWQREDHGDDGVKLSRQNTSCEVTHLRGAASGPAIVSQVVGQVSAQWQNFNLVDEGEAMLAGRSGAFAVGVGTNPRGVPAVFRIIAAGTGADVLTVLISSPQSEFASLKGELTRIEQSLTFGTGRTTGVQAEVDPAVAEKLAALDAACRAGVFTREECDKKRQALVNEGPASRSTRTGPGVPPATGTSPGRAMKFTRLSVRDPGINNVEAVSFLIPAGWKAEGGVQWFPDFMIQAVLLMKITDTQTGAAIEFLPLQNFSWNPQQIVPMPPGTNYMGAIIWPPIGDVPQFIQSFYASSTLRQLQNARIVANQDLPKVAAQSAQYHGVSDVRAGRVRYEYEAGGRLWEEDVYVTLLYQPTSAAMFWSVISGYSFRAPKGQLDALAPIMNTTINTLRLSMEWFAQYQYVQKLFVDRMMQGIRNAGRISDTIHRNNEEIQQMFADSYRRSCESQDRISQSYTEYIRGVETYRNPYEDRPVQLPSGYSNVWANASGEYILSDQAGFNPNVGSNVEWRRLERSP